MQKKIIIGGIAAIVFLAAVLTVLRSQTFKMRTNQGGSGFSADSGMMAPGVAGIPIGKPNAISPKGGNLAQRESLMESSVAPDAVSNVTDKKIIKNGNLDLKVSSVDRASEDISKIAKNNGGDVFFSNVYNRNNVKSGTVQIKVPVANFEKTFSEIKKVASLVVQESTSGQDVTEEYVDLQAQLKNKQAEEQQFVEIMKQAVKIQDILDVTEQLSRVRGEIEQLQGRIKFLDSQADMASIFVNMSEDTNITVTDSWRPWQVVKDSVNNLIKKIQSFVNFSIVLIITFIPVVILYLLLAYVIYLIGKKIYAKIKNRSGNVSN